MDNRMIDASIKRGWSSFAVKSQITITNRNFNGHQNRTPAEIMAEINPAEVSSILLNSCRRKSAAELEEVGTVLQVGDGIARTTV